ncbi:HPF/RaiA family ribosome-associated protein [Crenalkalicoccus roseus]|uniref:HPF/RaiA family ribosome-associated protein n=1 Tax=Crenalkalicoccus roseus TaxID=1485588 RepID=UPI0013051E8D|nr:HPF/RaiA family ribosome-associated protein [Crenalkalicoccus roseus]
MEPQRDAEDDPAPPITVSGHQVDVGERLRDHAIREIRDVAAKYFGGAEGVAVTFSRSGKGGFGCSIRIHAGRGLHFEGEAENGDAYLAFNQALERVAKQLRRRKRALKEDKPVNPAKEGPA